jgi:tetratricopeptide (TPR) repeat protein
MGMHPRLACTLLLVAGPAVVHAQVPDRFKNLQVFPRDIPRTELVATMRNWTGELGLRCHDCHEGPEDLQGMDFAIDTKPRKRAAREMLRLVLRINQETLASLPPAEGGRSTVSCHTCHRGLPKPPARLHDELVKAGLAGGADGARARLDELRKEHGEAGRYDFRPVSLWMAGRRLASQGRPDDGIALVRLSLERQPEPYAYVVLGQLLLAKGDRAEAAQAFKRALEAAPQQPEALRGLKEAQAEPTPAPR